MRRKHKLLFSITAILLIASIGIVAYLLSTSVYQRGYRTKIFQLWGNDLGGSLPQLENRTLLGNSSASITIIAYLDMSTSSSREFVTQILPSLDMGEIKYYHKHYITMQDIDAKTQSYLIAQRIDCLERLDPGDFSTLYPAILQGVEDDQPQILKIPGQYNISAAAFNACIAGAPSQELLQDASEVTSFGFQGISPQLVVGVEGHDNTIITGVPSLDSLQQTLQRYRIQLGK